MTSPPPAQQKSRLLEKHHRHVGPRARLAAELPRGGQGGPVRPRKPEAVAADRRRRQRVRRCAPPFRAAPTRLTDRRLPLLLLA
ncbi:hypothetical protein CDD83_2977 [Cordyceps sp. RAO-2017]|nr:hypothetical protein CDD83_2977 [Cordyceps sp. RAO-2017]